MSESYYGFLGLLFSAVVSASGGVSPERIVTPIQVFTLERALAGSPLAQSLQILEMGSDRAAGLWFLARSDDRYSIIGTSAGGQLRLLRELGNSTSAGLAVTPGAVATVIAEKGNGNRLVRFRPDGTRWSDITVRCATPGSLHALGERIASFCPDGTFESYDESGKASRGESWARYGTLFRALSPTELLILDQSSGQLLHNDLTTNGLTTLAANPDIQERAGSVAPYGNMKPSNPGEGWARMVSVQDAAISNGGPVYLLLYPYNRNEGALVLVVDRAGNTVARLRCILPAEFRGAAYKVAAVSQGLALLSTHGEVVIYGFR